MYCSCPAAGRHAQLPSTSRPSCLLFAAPTLHTSLVPAPSPANACSTSPHHVLTGWPPGHRESRPRRHVISHAKVKGPQVRYVCSNCGQSSIRHLGKCPGCGEFNTFEEERVSTASSSRGGGAAVSALQKAESAAKQLLVKSRHDGKSEWGEELNELYSGAKLSPSPSPPATARSWLSGNGASRTGYSEPVSLRRLSDAGTTTQAAQRMVLTGKTGQEINRVLGGGVVRGSFILVGGEPGVGKSTLTLQMAAMLAQPDLDFDALSEPDPTLATSSTPAEPAPDVAEPDQPLVKRRRSKKAASSLEPAAPANTDAGQDSNNLVPVATQVDRAPRMVLYVTGEETCEQVYDRAVRMGLQHCDSLLVLAESRMDVILSTALRLRPAAMVVDSLQTMYLPDLDNASGGTVQLKECAQALVRLAKDHYITVMAVGHVTRSSDIAGPKLIEHMVDAVLKMEGHESQAYRLLRAGKNRFGTTDEVGVFTMDQGGLHGVSNPSAMFLTNRSSGSSAVAVVMDGSRALPMEVQALVTPCYGQDAKPTRLANGIPKDRVFAIIISVMHKYVQPMSRQNVVVNVTGGMTMREPAGDLAIAVAIAASYFDTPVPRDVAAIGEVDLGGGLRPVKCLDLRLLELSKLGLREIIVPNVPQVTKLKQDPRLKGLTLTPCSTLLEALQAVLGPVVGSKKSRVVTAGSRGQEQGRKGKARQGQPDAAGEDDERSDFGDSEGYDEDEDLRADGF